MKLLPIIAAMMLATTAAADELTDLGLDDPHVTPPAETPGALDFYVGGAPGDAKPYLVSSETDLETIQVRAIFTF